VGHSGSHERLSLTRAQIEAANLTDWRPITQALQTRFRTGDFATGLRLVALIGEAAEQADHHPDLDLRSAHLNIGSTATTYSASPSETSPWPDGSRSWPPASG
jgi:pterin-4a-carbinolamine dehydratase